ncbi:organic cation/carnitine transporter 4-like [Durio zibethinus]|uniref:Organic cation/carnitine transporter 4-like n=1 Tax=Durio zibethinus TaxID=66656 RepID=A0A6P5WQH2_DURZI|nr:organic cation/carnitine transporter 4-like [Durio zibethinus]
MATLTGSDPSSHGSLLESPLLLPSKDSGWESGPGSEPHKLCIDDMLQIYCGEFGSWQFRHFVLTSLARALEAFHTMVMIFADQEPAWRCTKGSGSACDEKEKSVCGLEPGSWEWKGGSGSSTVAQWGLVCGDKYKVGLVQALFFGGCMIGLMFYFSFNTGLFRFYLILISFLQRFCILLHIFILD